MHANLLEVGGRLFLSCCVTLWASARAQQGGIGVCLGHALACAGSCICESWVHRHGAGSHSTGFPDSHLLSAHADGSGCVAETLCLEDLIQSLP